MDNNRDRITEKRIENNLSKAIECADDFNRNFDFTPGSIKDLEQILDYYSDDIRGNSFEEKEISDLANIFGSYLGQVLLNQRFEKEGYCWAKAKKSNFLVLKKDRHTISPVEKVYKRLLMGPKENIITYYTSLIEF